jgi:Tfp pilus assembly protein PilF
MDSTFVEAWGSLSFALSRVFFNGSREPAGGARAAEAFRRAIAIDSNNAIGHAAAAQYYTNVERDPVKADASLATAIQLAPNDPAVLLAAGRADVARGRFEVGIRRLERARELDPRSLAVMNDLERSYCDDAAVPGSGGCRRRGHRARADRSGSVRVGGDRAGGDGQPPRGTGGGPAEPDERHVAPDDRGVLRGLLRDVVDHGCGDRGAHLPPDARRLRRRPRLVGDLARHGALVARPAGHGPRLTPIPRCRRFSRR